MKGYVSRDMRVDGRPRESLRCGGHARHWFTVRGHVGLRSPKCVRCGAPNPATLTSDDWRDLLEYAPHLLDNPEAIRRSLEEEGIPVPPPAR